MLLLQQADFLNRSNFADFLNRINQIGDAVEIGTHRGEFALEFLTVWKGQHLYCVDHWLPNYDPIDPASKGDRQADYEHTLSILQGYIENGRAQILKMASVEAAKQLGTGSLDFAYIDGTHQYQDVSQDLLLWWPKLRSGGILAGHDIICPGEMSNSQTNWGLNIQPAVINFAYDWKVTVHLVVESLALPWSYYMVKP